MCAIHGFVPVLVESHEHIKTLGTGVADKVIGRHIPILTESSPGEEGSGASLW
jgi:hypothetical protein